MHIRISEHTLYQTALVLLTRVDTARRAGHNPVDEAFEAVGILRAFVDGYAEVPAPTSTALVAQPAQLETLFQAHLLCHICEERPWTTTAQWHAGVLLCAECASNEPNPHDEEG